MSQLTGRWLNAVKNADGTVALEFAFGNYPLSSNRIVMTLSSAEATALSNVLGGSTGANSLAKHATETQNLGNVDH